MFAPRPEVSAVTDRMGGQARQHAGREDHCSIGASGAAAGARVRVTPTTTAIIPTRTARTRRLVRKRFCIRHASFEFEPAEPSGPPEESTDE